MTQHQRQRQHGKQVAKRAPAARSAISRLFGEALRHHQAGRLTEAESLYRQALSLNPRHAPSLHFLGVIALQTGRYDLAIESIRNAITIDWKVGAYHSNLGAALAKQQRREDAIAAYHSAIALNPDLPEAHTNLGDLLADLGRLDEAIICHRKALALQPNLLEAHSNLGKALQRMGRSDEAVAAYRSAIRLRPNLAEAHYNLGSALSEQGALEEAAACYRTALQLRPEFHVATFNLANTLREQRRLDEAIEHYRRVIAAEPDFYGGHYNLGLSLLSRGDLAEGWREYEWRWSTPQMINNRPHFTQPWWSGEEAAGRTLLIVSEQGFGDTIQFCRYASLAAAAGIRVILQVQRPLVRLLEGLPGCDGVLGKDDDLPDFDLHCPLLSMPFALREVVTSIPVAEAYLHANPAQVAAWHSRLAAVGGPRVGLVWAGNPFDGMSPELAAQDRRRSLDPRRLAPLLEIAGLQFFNLQKGGAPPPADFALIDHMDEMQDFADTAALIANLDLVISVDTAVAHLAGALGKPVWMLDRFDACWRWIEGRRDSPWYPTMRIYRQTRAGDWNPVVAAVAEDLRELVSACAQA